MPAIGSYSHFPSEWEGALRTGDCPVSVNMIVRDEEPRMARVLRSLIALHPAEVLVADTGSSDQTKEIAERFGCIVFDLPWEDHFANTRNAVLAKSKQPWVLWIDADEEIESRSAELLCERIKSDSLKEPYQLVRFTDPPVSMYQCRLWKNTPETRWYGRIHEKVRIEGPHAKMADVVIMQHWDERRPDKHKRNLRLLDIAMAEEPSHPDHVFHAAILRHMIGEDDTAQAMAEKYLALAPREDVKTRNYMLYLLAYLATYKSHDYQRAVELIATALQNDPCAAELWCLLGNVFWWCKRMNDAHACYVNAIELGRSQTDILWLIDQDKYDKYPRERIAELEALGFTGPQMATHALAPFSG